MSFDAMKKNRKAAIDKLLNEAEKSSGGKNSYKDERFWSPTVDKSGNGYAIIRFLPAAEGEEVPWAQYWDHGFKGPTGRWYIEKSLTTIGQTDPVSEMNSQLWNTGRDEDKETARSRKRRLHYISNIYVVSDPAAPENEGKVFLYKFGKKIFDKITDVMQPEFEDEEPINPFDFWEGANFKMKIRQVEGYRNYDKSVFDSQTKLLDGDEDELRGIYEQLSPLKEFTDPSTFKSYEELRKKLLSVLGEENPNNTMENEETIESFPAEDGLVDNTTENSDDKDDDGTLSFLEKLANED